MCVAEMRPDLWHRGGLGCVPSVLVVRLIGLPPERSCMPPLRPRLIAVMVPVVALVAATMVVPTPAAADGVPGAFTLSGSGFGHGVGLSQYGAYAMAQEGKDAATIVTTYYPGTTVTAVDDSADIRVNLLHQVSGARLRSEPLAPDGGQVEVSIGSAVVVGSPADVFIFRPAGVGAVQVIRRSGGADTPLGTGPTATVRWAGTRTPGSAQGGPTLANMTDSTLDSPGHRYRYGFIEVSPAVSGTAINVVNILRLHDEYLYGISEVSSSWPEAAMQAQVLAARTYAMAKLGAGVRRACACHLDDGNGPYTDQTFTGWSKASASMGDRWVAAVNATHASETTGNAILFNGAPIQAFYQSSTGGFTTPVKELWGGNLPYAVSVADPWSLTPANPNRSWTRTVAQTSAAQAFGLPAVARLSVSARYTGGAVRQLTAIAPDGARKTISGAAMQKAFGLKSLYVNAVDGDPGVPLPTAPAPAAPAPVASGGPAASASPAPTPPAPASAAPTASASAAPVTFLLSIGPTTSPPEGSRVVFKAAIAPARKGVRVERQMLQPDGSWKTMGKARTNAKGRVRFVIKKAVPAGATYTYRLIAFDKGAAIAQSDQTVISVKGR